MKKLLLAILSLLIFAPGQNIIFSQPLLNKGLSINPYYNYGLDGLRPEQPTADSTAEFIIKLPDDWQSTANQMQFDIVTNNNPNFREFSATITFTLTNSNGQFDFLDDARFPLKNDPEKNDETKWSFLTKQSGDDQTMIYTLRYTSNLPDNEFTASETEWTMAEEFLLFKQWPSYGKIKIEFNNITVTDSNGGMVTSNSSMFHEHNFGNPPLLPVSLSVNPQRINEANGRAIITVSIPEINKQKNIVVQLGFSGSASRGIDYTVASTVTIRAGNLSGSTNLTSIDDQINEPNETIVVFISQIIHGQENGQQEKIITIIDNDKPSQPVFFSFKSPPEHSLAEPRLKILLNMINKTDKVALIQTDLYLPSGVTLKAVNSWGRNWLSKFDLISRNKDSINHYKIIMMATAPVDKNSWNTSRASRPIASLDLLINPTKFINNEIIYVASTNLMVFDPQANELESDGPWSAKIKLIAPWISSVDGENNENNNLSNYPNPFNSSTTISYFLEKSAQVSIVITDIMGQTVSELINNKSQASGQHKIVFAPKNNLAKGNYFCFISILSPRGYQRKTIKISFIK